MGVLGPDSRGRLQETELPVTEPAAGQVLIRVERAGVAFGDVIRSDGRLMPIRSYPMVPGYDVAGSVEKTGPGVTDLRTGDRVTAYCQTGGYARYLTLDSSLVLPIPRGIGVEAGVALNLNYLTAWQMIHRVAGLKRGDSAFTHSAAGGVGTAILDIARLEGIRMFGACSAGKLDFVRGLGADAVDYRTTDYVGHVLSLLPGGVDAAFDALGPANAPRTRPLVRKGGRLILFGYLGSYASGAGMREMLKLPGLLLMGRGRRTSLYGINVFARRDWYREDMGRILSLAAAGRLSPIIDSVIPLRRAAEAHERLKSGAVRGKIVLDCT